MNLLDNYEMSTGSPETVTAEELAEDSHFLDAILETSVMKVTPSDAESLPASCLWF